jgi:hypothetical protein
LSLNMTLYSLSYRLLLQKTLIYSNSTSRPFFSTMSSPKRSILSSPGNFALKGGKGMFIDWEIPLLLKKAGRVWNTKFESVDPCVYHYRKDCVYLILCILGGRRFIGV